MSHVEGRPFEWADVFSRLAETYGWTPTEIGNLTWQQLAFWVNPVSYRRIVSSENQAGQLALSAKRAERENAVEAALRLYYGGSNR